MNEIRCPNACPLGVQNPSGSSSSHSAIRWCSYHRAYLCVNVLKPICHVCKHESDGILNPVLHCRTLNVRQRGSNTSERYVQVRPCYQDACDLRLLRHQPPAAPKTHMLRLQTYNFASQTCRAHHLGDELLVLRAPPVRGKLHHSGTLAIRVEHP